MTRAFITKAVEDILVESFKDQLSYGPAEYAYGNSKMFRREAEAVLDAAKRANAAGQLTHSHLLLCATFDALASEDLGDLRHKLVGVGSLVVDWLEQLDRQAGR